MEIKYSFIIPVFNSGDVLLRCVNSIVSNNSFSYEVIIVDDGSTDKQTSMLCDELSSSFSNVFSFHKKNEGPYLARLFGYSLAKGEYIFTPDSDDYFCEGFLDKIDFILKNESIDILSFNIFDKIDAKLNISDKKQYPSEVIEDKRLFLDLFFDSFSQNQSLARKCFKKSLLQRITPLKTGGKIFEDGLFSLELFAVADSVIFLNEPLYVYDHSCAESLTKRSIFFNSDHLELLLRISNFISEHFIFEDWRINNYNSQITLLALNYIKNIINNSCGLKEKRKALKAIYKNGFFKTIIKKPINPKILKKQRMYLFASKHNLTLLFIILSLIEKI